MSRISYTVQEVIAASGLGRTKIFQLLAMNSLRRVKVGRRTLITAASVHALLGVDTAEG